MPEQQQECTMNTLFNKIEKIGNGMERFDERQEKIAEDVAKIKEAVYNPDSGLYARIRVLEQWKESQSKLQWTMMTAIIGLIAATVYKAFITI